MVHIKTLLKTVIKLFKKNHIKIITLIHCYIILYNNLMILMRKKIYKKPAKTTEIVIHKFSV